MSDKGQTSQADRTLQTGEERNDDQITHDTQMATGGQIQDPAEMTDNPDLTYNWETSEMLQLVRDFPISDYGTNYDGKSSSGFTVPEPPSLSGIIDSTVDKSSSSETTDVEEKYVEDDMSSLSHISDITVSTAQRRHEYLKERVEREGNIYDKLYNASLKGQLTIVKDILTNHETTSLSDELGQTPLYAACIGNHPEIINLLVDAGYDVNHQDNEGKTPLHMVFENHEPGIANTLMTQFSADTEVRDIHNWTPLHTAVDRGYFLYSQQLSEKFFQEDPGTEVSWIQLHVACFQENAQNIQTLVDAETNVNHASSAGHTPLHIAVTKSNIDLVSYLLDQKADVNSINSDGQTPLHIAVDKGEENIIQQLLAKKANPNLKDVLGNTSLHLAVQMKHELKPGLLKCHPKVGANGSVGDCWHSPASYKPCSIKTVQAIVNYGADVNAVNNRCQTPLWFACFDGQDNLVKILLNVGADPNIADENSDSSLHAAIYGYCSTETVQNIISNGAQVNAVNNIGETPLLIACSTAQNESVRLLLKSKADPGIANIEGHGSLHKAVDADCCRETLQEIIGHGADVNAKDKRGRTALLLSCFYRQVDSLKVLIEAGADPTINDEEDFSCIHAAVDGRCSTDVLQTLIDHGAHVNDKRKDGTSALIRSCRTGQSESVMFLLAAGADVNNVKLDGNTSLHVAVHGNCSKETLQNIIEHGLNVNTANKRGETALILACESAQAESIEILLEMGADRDIADGEGCTSLHAAIHGRCPNEALKKIITRKSHLDAQNMDGQTPLLLACTHRQNNAVKLLLEVGSNPNITDKNKNTSLHAAVHGHCRKKDIQAIIDNFADINAINKNKQTALMIACENGNANVIKVLLKNRADLDIANADGDTCIHVVARRDYSKDIIHTMVNHGANVNTKNMFNETPLMKANKNGNIDATKELLNAGADHTILDGFGDTWIHQSIDGGYRQELIQTMIDHGADVNAINKRNETAFMKACKTGNVDAIKLLLSVGANPNIENDDGETWIHHTVIGNWSREVLQVVIAHGGDVNAATKGNITALMLASRTGNADVINVLLAAGADPNITDADGYTCLHDAIDVGCTKETLTAFINHGANIHAANKKGVTPLMGAVWKGNIDAIKVLLTAGADRKDCDTCLHSAIRNKCGKEILQRVISHGADVNAKNEHGVTALGVACQMGNKDAINELLKAGADPNIVDEAGETCLHITIRGRGSQKHLEALITQGADVNATNKNSVTALQVACQMKNEDAISVLLKAGADPAIKDKHDYTYLHQVVKSTIFKNALDWAIANTWNDIVFCIMETLKALRVACQMGDIAVISILLQSGVDFNTEDIDGDTCLHKAVRYSCNKEVFQTIVNPTIVPKSKIIYALKSMDLPTSLKSWRFRYSRINYINATNMHNQTALMLACEKGNTDAINVLLNAGADPNISDGCGAWIHRAINGSCSKETIWTLIKHDADVNAKNMHNETALMRACREGHIGTINTLLSVGADPNITDKDGDTCLHTALRHSCSKEVLQTIIDHGAHVNATNKNNETALMLACANGSADVIDVLVTVSADGATCCHEAARENGSKEILPEMADNDAYSSCLQASPLCKAYWLRMCVCMYCGNGCKRKRKR